MRRVIVRDTPEGRRYACRCCGYLTLMEQPDNTFEICPVCRWNDDGLQFEDPDRTGGANTVSLNQARSNFRRFRVSDLSKQGHGRPPRTVERP